MPTKDQQGFWNCGKYVHMGEPTKPYIESLKEKLKDIRLNALKNKIDNYKVTPKPTFNN